jgi:hypothetical protein
MNLTYMQLKEVNALSLFGFFSSRFIHVYYFGCKNR